jgi:hypothetical protein
MELPYILSGFAIMEAADLLERNVCIEAVTHIF